MNKLKPLENMILSRTGKEGIEIYEFTSPANLYLSGEQALTYLEAVLTSAYQSHLAEPLRYLIHSHIKDLIGPVDRPTALIDLGPGIPLNSLPVINYLKIQDQSFCYVPVDISKAFLTITSCFFEDEQFETIPLNLLFEDLSSYLADSLLLQDSYKRVINVGLTFNNYPMSDMCVLLKSIFRKGDQVLAASEVYDTMDEEACFAPYRTKAAERFNFLPLRALGFSRDHLEYFVRLHGERIEMGFSIKEPITFDLGETIPIGVELVTSVSYRYTESGLLNGLQSHFSCVEICRDKHASVCLITME